MKNYAFKRAKHCPAVKDSLHPEYIVEYADISLFEPGFHKHEDGYEIMPEDSFQDQLAKNQSLHQEFLEKKAKSELELQAIAAQKSALDAQRERKDRQEYEEFLKWKKNKGK